MSRAPVTGSLAFIERDGMVMTCGRLEQAVSLSGPLSEDRVTLGIGLRISPGSWHWHEPVGDGSVGVFRPGDEHDSLYRAGSLYAAVSLSQERLEIEAAALDMVLDDRTLGGTRFRTERIDPRHLAGLCTRLDRVHDGGTIEIDPSAEILQLMITHCARKPKTSPHPSRPNGHGPIVGRARSYILAKLHEPIRVEEIAAAVGTSKRTLYRAFMEFLGEPPNTYVRRLRLHRIRHDLASETEAACSIALIANQWGIGEPGRLSGWYRELFGELPSAAVARRRAAASAKLARSA
ncbi:helix-turn-helix transcriptional regulator [Martelella alba]|uniref:Helix-turn-helix transcriptional regulator n=2 Tax=Martelella alba TaxID=2590451 RepID=A0A506U3B3_9HYPH|nr:helix-turn-helix transcriptional regulator [Martelella alba]